MDMTPEQRAQCREAYKAWATDALPDDAVMFLFESTWAAFQAAWSAAQPRTTEQGEECAEKRLSTGEIDFWTSILRNAVPVMKDWPHTAIETVKALHAAGVVFDSYKFKQQSPGATQQSPGSGSAAQVQGIETNDAELIARLGWVLAEYGRFDAMESRWAMGLLDKYLPTPPEQPATLIEGENT